MLALLIQIWRGCSAPDQSYYFILPILVSWDAACA